MRKANQDTVALLIDAKLRLPDRNSKGFLHVVVDGRNDIMTYEMIKENYKRCELYWLEWELNPYVADRVRKENSTFANTDLPFIPKEICTDIDLQLLQAQSRERKHDESILERYSRKEKRGKEPPTPEDEHRSIIDGSVVEHEQQQRREQLTEYLAKDCVIKVNGQRVEIGHDGTIDVVPTVEKVVEKVSDYQDAYLKEFTEQWNKLRINIQPSDKIPIYKPEPQPRVRHQVWRLLLNEDEAKLACHKLGCDTFPPVKGPGKHIITWRSYLVRIMTLQYETAESVKQLVRSGILPRYPYATHAANNRGSKGRSGSEVRKQALVKSLLLPLQFVGLEFVNYDDLKKFYNNADQKEQAAAISAHNDGTLESPIDESTQHDAIGPDE